LESVSQSFSGLWSNMSLQCVMPDKFRSYALTRSRLLAFHVYLCGVVAFCNGSVRLACRLQVAVSGMVTIHCPCGLLAVSADKYD